MTGEHEFVGETARVFLSRVRVKVPGPEVYSLDILFKVGPLEDAIAWRRSMLLTIYDAHDRDVQADRLKAPRMQEETLR